MAKEPAVKILGEMSVDELRALETERYQCYTDQHDHAGKNVALFREYSDVVNEIQARLDRDESKPLPESPLVEFYALPSLLPPA
jgi:hypothetical protein